MKKFLSNIKSIVRSPWLAAIVMAIIVSLFAIWYGAAWSLVVALPIIYDYYVGHHISRLHQRLMERYAWWRVAYGVWCAAVFALVVGVIVHMLIFKWEQPFIITFAVILLYALWEEMKSNSKVYVWIYGWVHAIIFATVVATIIQIYWFQMFVIPTGSMESTLMAGDYILVNKVSYGARVPQTPLSFPFVHNTMPLNDNKASFSTCWQRDYRRLKGLGDVERGDVVVFNFPEGDTVVMEMQAMSYYQLLRDRNLGSTVAERRRNLHENFTVVARPMDKKENYIKRCVALPGDTLKIVDGTVYCNGVAESYIPNKQYYYYNRLTGGPLKMGFDAMSGGRVELPVRDAELSAYADTARYDLVKMGDVMRGALIPHLSSGRTTEWTLDDFGELWVPKAGATIELNDENMALYGRCIAQYEGHDVEQRDGKIYIDGVERTEYSFEQDYYFMMGDNRHGSLDSRFWGFVPEDHIVGKASYVWFSVDQATGAIRWERMFKSIL